ncbi:MAG: cation:dicarboxylase symporter family transporter [Candidatus Aminicenantes bacterium]|nr:cation:dicarboxylase symporter family transporter [Candidatus Aminicenantes bacterium]
MKKIKLHTKIFIGLTLGIIVGLVFGEKARLIEPVGTIFLRLITMIVVPLVLVSLMLGTASLGDIRKLGRIGIKTIAYFTITTMIAISIGLFLANVVNPGYGLNEQVKEELYKNYESKAQIGIQRMKEKPSALDVLVDIVPTNPLKSLVEGNMLQVIFLALLFGIILTLIKKERAEPLIKFLEGLNDAIIQVVHIAMRLAPYGVLALIAAVIGQYGVQILVTLLKYSLVVVGGLVIYTFSINSLTVGFLGRLNPLRFYKGVKEAMIIAFSTSSSNAALPVSLECVEYIGVPREYSSFVIPLGATINMDGTALYQGVAAVFIAQIYGVPLGIMDQLTIVLMATLASVGAAGVPAAGIITLAMVLRQIGVPLEGIALILGVDRFLDMCRTTTNIVGDMACSVVIKETETRRK